MKPKHLKEYLAEKNRWAEPLSDEDRSRGFKGWHLPGNLPHFDVPGARQIVTYRLADALPAVFQEHRRQVLPSASSADDRRRFEELLDRGHGACHLRNPEVAAMVQESLWHHDGAKYRLLAWVIMPNHVHVVVEIWDTSLSVVVQGWKSYTARTANRMLGRSGTFWQDDYHDRCVRDDGHLQRAVRYIEANPVTAGLACTPEEWPWSSAPYRGESGVVVPVLSHRTANRVPPAGGPE